MKKTFDEEAVVQAQAEREYMIKDNLPDIEGLSFNENYGVYPEVLYKTSSGEELRNTLIRRLSKNGFDANMVEIGHDQHNREITFTFDLERFDETNMQLFFKELESILPQKQCMFTEEEKLKLAEIQKHFKAIENIYLSLGNETQEKVLEYHSNTGNIHHYYYYGLQAIEELLNEK